MRGWVAGMLGLVVLVGCAGGSPPPVAAPSDPLPRPVAAPSPSPSPTDPFARPAVVDAAWVERVYDALAAIEGRAVRTMVQAHEGALPFPQEAVTLFRSIYGPDLFAAQVGHSMQLYADPQGMEVFRRPVGRTQFIAERILFAAARCVVVRGLLDRSQTAASPGPPVEVQLVLAPLDPERDPDGHNPTGWMMVRRVLAEDAPAEPGGEQCPD